MEKRKFSREQAFTLHQKIMLIGFSAMAFFIFIELININLTMAGNFITFLFFFISLFFLALAFSEKTLIKINDKLYKGKSIFGVVIHRKNVKLTDRSVVSILKFKKNQKFAFVSAASPDQTEAFNSFELFVLNKNHTKRDSVLYFRNEENADEAIDFLSSDFPLKKEIFSPNFD